MNLSRIRLLLLLINAFLDGWNLCNSFCHADVNQLQVSPCLLLCFNHSFAFRFIYPFNVCKSSIFLHSLPHTLLVEAEKSERVQLVHVFYFLCMLSAYSCSYCKLWTIVAESSILPRRVLAALWNIAGWTRGNVFYLSFHADVAVSRAVRVWGGTFSRLFFMPSRSSLLLCREMARSIYGECAMYEYIYLDHQTLFLRGWVSQSAIGGPSM